MTDWSLVYEGFDPAQEGLREALCTVGNGYFATRGAAPEAVADEVHYPGTYVAEVYDRLTTEIAGRAVENEDLVNAPNWLVLTFRCPGEPWFDLAETTILHYRQELDIRRGVLARLIRFRDLHGRTTTMTQRRLVSMSDPHLAGIETTLVAEDWSGRLEVRSGLDGRVTNSGVARYRDLRGDHLVVTGGGELDPDIIWLETETRGSRISIAEAARTRLLRDGGSVPVDRRLVRDGGFVAHDLRVELEEGIPATIEKVVTLFNSRDEAVYEPGTQARAWIERADSFEELMRRHVLAWGRLWRRFDTRIDGPLRTQMTLRLHVFHLLQTVSENSLGLDAGVPARGLHGEAYRGHVFWDELFILPFLDLRLPVLSRNLLEYRYRRLPEARWAARQEGFRGAMFPWQSGSDGREESQAVHLNPRSGRWLPDNSRLQRHINLAIAYNVWHHWQAVGDPLFLRFRGAPMILEIARFWASAATYSRTLDRYEIRGVMGPDEYHDAYPEAKEPGLNNNAYTNVMAAWVLWRAQDILDGLPEHYQQELWEELALSRDELERFNDVSRRMYVPFHDGVISQFEGYENLEEFGWLDYQERYGDIQRLDRILEAEGDSPNRYKVSKQADVLMLFYLLPPEELVELFGRLRYEFDPQADIPRNVEYYLQRTAHGSTLSRLVHSWVLARMDRARSWDFFQFTLESDVADVQGGTTQEGVHLGAMAGTVDLVQRSYGGVEIRNDVIWINPVLPEQMPALELSIHYRGQRLEIHATAGRVRVSTRSGPSPPVKVRIGSEIMEIGSGETREFETGHS